jgi:MFS family permease
MLFVLSMFYRVSIAVIAPNLIDDLQLNAETIGLLGGAFFYAFAVMQIPMGPLLDFIGPRIVISCFAFIGAIGSIIFAMTETCYMGIIARLLIGVGMAAMLMGAFKVFTLMFPTNMFSTLAGVFISIGTIGNMLGASPLAYFVESFGWRSVFFFTGALSAVLGIVTLFVLVPAQKNDDTLTATTRNDTSFSDVVKIVIRSLSFWQIGVIAFFRYGTFITLQGLWLGLYLINAKHFSPVEAGNILIMLSVGNIIGGPIAGRLSDAASRGPKSISLAGLSLYCLTIFSLSGIFPINHKTIFMVVAFLSGFFFSFGTLLYAHAKNLFPVHIAGTVMAWVNFFMIMGAAVLMSVFGKVVEQSATINPTYNSEIYELCFLFSSILMAASLVFYAFSRRE